MLLLKNGILKISAKTSVFGINIKLIKISETSLRSLTKMPSKNQYHLCCMHNKKLIPPSRH